MNWDDVRIFLAVARSGQILGAARRLGLNHATVSRRLAALESDLKARLVNRTTTGTELTVDGERFLEAAERMESAMINARAELSRSEDEVSGTVRIGAPDGFGVAWLASRLGAITEIHPSLSVQLVPIPRTFSLSRREADIAITVERPAEGRLIAGKLVDYSLGLYASRTYVEAHGMPQTANALLDEAGWVMGDDGVREKDDLKLTFTCTTITGDSARRPIAEFAQQAFKEVGIDMQLEEAPISAILEGLRNGTTEASLFNWTYGSVDPDPSVTLRSDGGQNWNSFENARVDELIDLGLQTVVPEERQAYYHEIQQIVVEEVPMLYLQWDDWYNVFTSRVQGLPDSANDAFSIYYNGLHQWSLAPA